MNRFIARMMCLWVFSALLGASMYFASPSRADGGWQPCRETSPLVPCSMDSMYPCGPNTPIWKCPPDVPDSTLVQLGSDFFGGHTDGYAREELGYIGRIYNNEKTLPINDPHRLINLGRSVCEEMDAAQGKDDSLDLNIIERINRAYQFKQGEGGLIVGAAFHWFCPKWRPVLYGYHVNPDGSVDGAP